MRLFLKVLCACLFLCACNKKNNWSHEKIHSNYKEFSYSKVLYQADNPIHGIDLEFVQIKEQLKTYLFVHSTPVPSCKMDTKKIRVTIQIEDILIEHLADRLEGGQRFLLDARTAQIIIGALIDKKNVIISIPGYQSHIHAEGFTKYFQKIGRSFMENPFHLPF